MIAGHVIKLDRGYPLVRADNGEEYRCQHATAILKNEEVRAVIGDRVMIDECEGNDKAIIMKILPRVTELVRKDPTEQASCQVLAANFDRILIFQPLDEVNVRRLERELVLAHETGALVGVVLAKADLVEDEGHAAQVIEHVRGLLHEEELFVMSNQDSESVEKVRAFIPERQCAVLVGKSGVGKSSFVNILVGEEVQETQEVRASDGKGRHTTVSREMVEIPGGGVVIDMPGIRGVGLWDAAVGIEIAFPDIEELALQCKFRDCNHEGEPGCAVEQAVECGDLELSRLESYARLKQEVKEVQERREEAERLRVRGSRSRNKRLR